jgi:Aminoglycoside-2''-adenylyltransferase
MMDETASLQLDALAGVVGLLEEAAINYWLFGGWAIDFYAGRVTRPHDDVDMALWLTDLPATAALLEAHGWHHAPQEDEDGGTGFERHGVRLEFTFLERDGEAIITLLKNGRIDWPREAFADDFLELHDVRSRVIAREHLAGMKSFVRDDPNDAAKDRADRAALAEHIPPSVFRDNPLHP